MVIKKKKIAGKPKKDLAKTKSIYRRTGSEHKIDNKEKIEKILSKVKEEIRPDLSILRKVDNIVSSINAELKRRSIAAECVKGGSIAKETFLKNDHDADLFVRFNESYRSKDTSSILEGVLKNAVKGTEITRVHGSRDYFQFRKGSIDFEVIPVLKIRPEDYKSAENVTDLSPEHVSWAKKYTSRNPQLTDEIRLLKRFCKANKIYGAESYICGLSGHIVDILVIHYGSFLDVLKAVSQYKNADVENPIVIDHEHNLTDPLKELNASKISPLIIVDPIQKDRNAAAALSKEKLDRFIEVSREFLKAPNIRFFHIEKFDMKKQIENEYETIREQLGIRTRKDINKALETIIIDIKTLDGSKDIVGTKVLKVYELILRHLSLNSFKVIASGWNFEYAKRKAQIYMILHKETLSEYVEQQGPPRTQEKDHKNFISKHEQAGHKVYEKHGRIYTRVPRKYMTPKMLLKDMFTQYPVSSRLEKIAIRQEI